MMTNQIWILRTDKTTHTKHLNMNKFGLIIMGILMSGGILRAQFSEDAEATQGNRSELINQCWTMYGWTVSNSDVISGNYVLRSGQQNNPQSPARLFTPYLNFSGSGSIDFAHALNAANGSFREVKLFLVDDQANRVQTLYTHTYRSGNVNVNGDPTLSVSTSLSIGFSGIYRLEWELNGTGGSSRGVIDDIVISASYATDPTDCSPLQACQDSDGDGVCDQDDDFPQDPEKAYAYYLGLETWAFEDLFPKKGDYDLNDIVASVNPLYISNASNEVVSIEMNTTIEALGSGFRNGLALRFRVLEAGVGAASVNVSGSLLNGDYAVIASNGVEAGHLFDIVAIVAEGVRDAVDGFQGPYFRTVSGGITGSTTPVKVVIDFNNPVNPNSISYEYFLIKKADRGTEVHQASSFPTALADLSVFSQPGTDINPDPAVFYKTYDNLPWALRVAGNFDWPKEKVDINEAYSKFASWAQSGGLVDQDWYVDPASRDESKIY